MRYCSTCVMPDTRPGSIFKGGICQACLNYSSRKNIDWNKKYRELEGIFSFYRSVKKPYDCAVPVSGGKDSHFLVYLAKVVMKMNPLLIRIGDGFTTTEAGKHNIRNLSDTFSCDIVEFTPSIDIYRRMTRICFEKLGNMPFVDSAIYNASCDTASYYGLQLTLFGESPQYEYGTIEEQIKDKEVLTAILNSYDGSFWHNNGFTNEEVAFIAPPSQKHKTLWTVMPIFASHYLPWNGYHNYEIAKKYGFQDLTHEWIREDTIENFDSIDAIGWQISNYWKWQKFGYSRANDIASRWIREGKITRQEGIKLVKEHEGKLDNRVLEDFLKLTRYTLSEYNSIAEKWWNRDIFENTDGIWHKKREHDI